MSKSPALLLSGVSSSLSRKVPEERMALILPESHFEYSPDTVYSDSLAPLFLEGGSYERKMEEVPAWEGAGETTESWVNAAECFEKGQLTQIGREIASVIRGKTVIDLGCGNPRWSVVPRTCAKQFGARYYLGVDVFGRVFYGVQKGEKRLRQVFENGNYVHGEGMNAVDIRKAGDTTAAWFHDDMLGFLSKIAHVNGVVFFINGIDDASAQQFQTARVMAYNQALAEEMTRISHQGDMVIGRGMSSDQVKRLQEQGWKMMPQTDVTEGYDITLLTKC